MSISDSNKRIVSVATQSFATASTIKAYWDDNRQSSIEILSCPGSPHAGVTSFSTLGLSDHPIPNGRKQLPLRVELVGACGSQFDEFANILASAAFCIINSNWLCHPGAMVTGHGENQIGGLDRLAGKQLRTMAAEIQTMFQPDQIRTFGDWRPIPRAGAGGRYGNLFRASAGERDV